ncbi:hypothetical protein ACFL96_19980 [Thermoproteota archaeon]
MYFLKRIYRKSILPIALTAGLLGIACEHADDPRCDEWYEQAYGCLEEGQDEITEREEIDFDMDGKPDWINETGYDCLDNIVAERYDMNADGKPDWIVDYDYNCDGQLSKKYYDIGGDGECDYAQKYEYDKDGKLEKIRNDWDCDGDYECYTLPSGCDDKCDVDR